uniref:ATP-dependent Clp protease proteolytic subunit n=1 Tax=Evolvulus nuttallianus TaxID=197389 RepID=A0A0K1Z792_9ASTE|nr:ATP-dependent Clp protease proteolytic subunit [Evolvulus nuttallianus]
MPIGVPKVPFRSPGDEDASWTDIYNRLYRQRCLFLAQPIDDQVSNQLAGLLVFLSMENSNPDIYILINSPGGGVLPGLCIYDTMQMVLPDVATICIGIAASMASLILAGGEVTKRMAFPHARVMIHQPMSSFFEAQAREFVLETNEVLTMRYDITKAYAKRTGLSSRVINKDIERDYFLSARRAKDFGLIDLILSDLHVDTSSDSDTYSA